MQDLKHSTPYILYEIINTVFEKAFNIVNDTKLDIKKLEKKVFDKGDNALVKDIMVKKRNIVILKHIFRSQVVVLRQLKDIVPSIHDESIVLYFDELEDKLNQIISEIDILWENIDSIEDAFKSMIDIKTNFTVKILTTFSAFMLPLTLITSFYGMNVSPLPYATKPLIVYGIMF